MQRTQVFALLLGILMLSQYSMSCTLDSDCGNADAPGACVAGICQCGVGFLGNTAVDPVTCSLVCTPPPVPDSVAFLKEPTVTLGASAGNLQVAITQDSYLKQNPTTVAFLNPVNGLSCPLMSSLLGSNVWTQGVNNGAGQCDQQMDYSAQFAGVVGQTCWETLPDSLETGANYEITFRNYQTQLEIIQSGLAPFGQAARVANRAETTISREFRRNYTISVATQFKPNSALFLVEATGKVQYRLVVIDYDLLNDKVVVQVETRVEDSAKLLNATINAGSVGLSTVLSPVALSDCDASSPAGFCTQFATVEFAVDPCKVTAADLRLDAVFGCADGNAADTCGYTGLPPADTFVLPNNIIDYDACPVIVSYGLDVVNSWIRLHEDVARAVVISAPPLQESTVYGRCQLQAEGDAVFSSATLTAVHVWQVASPANIDLGDQKSASFLTVALDTSTSSVPTIDFELEIDPAFFSLNAQYYLEAYLELTFANTGPLTRKLAIPLAPAARSMSLAAGHKVRSRARSGMDGQLVFLHANRAGDAEAQNDKGVFSPTFKIREGESSEAGTADVGLIVGATIGGLALIAGCVVAGILLKRKKDSHDNMEESTEGSMDV